MSTEPIACKACRHHVHLPESIAVCVSDDAPDSFDAVYGVYRSELLADCSKSEKAMTEKLTACGECEYMVENWKTLMCAVAPYPRQFEYVIGRMVNGPKHGTDFVPCYAVNIDGHCPHFQEKERGKADGV